jgi:hypothetical protein
MNEVIEQPNIEEMIYEIKGVPVMLDYDLASLYQCANGTKSINLAVNRNKNKFPDDFYFQINEIEFRKLWFQNETTSRNMIRTMPYVFTEQGVSQLATVLHTEVAAKISEI